MLLELGTGWRWAVRAPPFLSFPFLAGGNAAAALEELSPKPKCTESQDGDRGGCDSARCSPALQDPPMARLALGGDEPCGRASCKLSCLCPTVGHPRHMLPSPCTHPWASLGGRGHPRPGWMDTACRNASLASLSCQAEDKFLLSQWPFGRQFIYLGCCSLIVHGNVYPKYLIAGLHKLRLPGEEAQAAVGTGTNVSSPGTAKVKDTFLLLPKKKSHPQHLKIRSLLIWPEASSSLPDEKRRRPNNSPFKNNIPDSTNSLNRESLKSANTPMRKDGRERERGRKEKAGYL